MAELHTKKHIRKQLNMLIHDFGSNFTLQQIKEILIEGKGYVCELQQEMSFKDNDYIGFDGILHTYKEWKEFFRLKI